MCGCQASEGTGRTINGHGEDKPTAGDFLGRCFCFVSFFALLISFGEVRLLLSRVLHCVQLGEGEAAPIAAQVNTANWGIRGSSDCSPAYYYYCPATGRCGDVFLMGIIMQNFTCIFVFVACNYP